MILPIKTYPDEILTQVAKPVGKDEDVSQLIDDMFETMYASNAVGLSANQVGVLKRVIVVDISPDKSEPLALINPMVANASLATIDDFEWCLSFTGGALWVRRFAEIRVEYNDRDFKMRSNKATGLLARCLQHEIDHLNGILMTDRFSENKG